MLGVRVEKIVLVNGDALAVSLRECMFLMAIGVFAGQPQNPSSRVSQHLILAQILVRVHVAAAMDVLWLATQVHALLVS